MTEQPTQTEIANALGLAKSRITAMKKMGCPMSSIKAAKAWHARNISPTMHARNVRPTTSGCNALPLARAAGKILEAGGSIEEFVPGLRAALRAVPVNERGQVTMPIVVWKFLCADVIALMESEPEHEAKNTAPDDDADYMGEFWYQVASGSTAKK